MDYESVDRTGTIGDEETNFEERDDRESRDFSQRVVHRKFNIKTYLYPECRGLASVPPRTGTRKYSPQT
jgi:hypothetical protein